MADWDLTGASAMSSSGNRRDLISNSQNLELRSLTWLLSRTNPHSTFLDIPSFDARGAPKPGERSQREREKLYGFLEAFAAVLERNHESIVIDTGDIVGFNTYVATSFPSAAPSTLDHIVIDTGETKQYSHVLNIPPQHEWIWPEPPPASTVRLVEAKSLDNPVPTSGHPAKYPDGFAHWVLKHHIAQVNRNVFVTDVSFAEHMGNIIEAIKETHRHIGDAKAIDNAHINLGMYVYLSCSARLLAIVNRGVHEYPFGRMLTADIADNYDLDPGAHHRDFYTIGDGDSLIGLPLHRRKLTVSELQKLSNLIERDLPLLDIQDADLNAALPESLIHRETFYDAGGRLLFHELLTAIIVNIQRAVNRVVGAKRNVMENQLRYAGLYNMRHGLAARLDHNLVQDFHACRLLNVLATDFLHILESHVIWLSQVFASNPNAGGMGYETSTTRRPPGHIDDFAGLSRSVTDPAMAASCLSWIRLLCRQERGMAKLRLPINFDKRTAWKRQEENYSFHIRRATVWHVSITAAADSTTMKSLFTTIKELGFTTEEIRLVFHQLVEEGRVTKFEAEHTDTAKFGGCVGALALIILLHQLEHRRANGHPAADTRQAPHADITRCFHRRHIVAFGSNAPQSRAALLMLWRAQAKPVAGPEALEANALFDHRGETRWAQTDLPSWTPQDIASDLIWEAACEARQRIRDILDDLTEDESQSSGSSSTDSSSI